MLWTALGSHQHSRRPNVRNRAGQATHLPSDFSDSWTFQKSTLLSTLESLSWLGNWEPEQDIKTLATHEIWQKRYATTFMFHQGPPLSENERLVQEKQYCQLHVTVSLRRARADSGLDRFRFWRSRRQEYLRSDSRHGRRRGQGFLQGYSVRFP